MTGQEFEQWACQWFRNRGYWALNIPKNKFGAQPFDVLAIRGSDIWAVDCKVCSKSRFPLSRVEDNQWLAFDLMQEITNAICGFMCWYNGLFFIPYSLAKKNRENGNASILLGGDLWVKETEIGQSEI